MTAEGSFLFQKTIAKTAVSVEIIFKGYTEQLFCSDIEILKLVNSGKSAPDKQNIKLRQYDIFKRRSLIKIIKKGLKIEPNYSFFKEFCSQIFAKTIFNVLKNDFPQFIKNKEKMHFQLEIINKYEYRCLANHDFARSQKDLMVLQFSGSALAGRVYFPWLCRKRVDASFLERTLIHEMEHQLEHLKGLYQEEEKIQQKIKLLSQNPTNHISPGLPYLYETLCNFYTEGLATYLEHKDTAFLTFSLEQISHAKEALLKLSLCDSKTEAEKILLKDFKIKGEDAEYHLGCLMAYFVALTETIRLKKKVTIISAKTKEKLTDLKDLMSFILNSREIRLGKLDEKAWDSAYQMLGNITHHSDFIKTYLKACHELKITQVAVIIDMELYKTLLNNATGNHSELLK